MRDLTIVLGVDATQFIDARYLAFYDTSISVKERFVRWCTTTARRDVIK